MTGYKVIVLGSLSSAAALTVLALGGGHSEAVMTSEMIERAASTGSVPSRYTPTSTEDKLSILETGDVIRATGAAYNYYDSAAYDDYDATVIWGGYSHFWTYNHRLNRLGSFVSFDGGCAGETCQADLTHAAASGSGSDCATIKMPYTQVVAQGLHFKTGYRTLDFYGDEGDVLSDSVDVEYDRSQVRPEGRLVDDDYVVLLQGFDVMANGEPQKLDRFKIQISDAHLDEDADEVSFTISAKLRMDCDSIECDWFDNKVDYELTVYYVVIGIDSRVGSWLDETLSVSDSWDKKDSQVGTGFHSDELAPGTEPNYAFVGMRGFEVNLDDDHWMDGMSQRISSSSLSSDGDFKYYAYQYFREYDDGSSDCDISFWDGYLPEFAESRAGSADLSMNVVGVFFEDGCTSFKTWSPGMDYSYIAGDSVSRAETTEPSDNFSLASLCEDL